MRRTITLLILLLALVGEARAGSGTILYIPLMVSVRTDGLGLEVHPGLTAGQPELYDLAPRYLRSNFAPYGDPLDTLYQHYLSGGWPAVDTEVSAELDLWRDIGAEPVVIFMYGGSCSAPTTAQLSAYGDFIVAAADRYGLDYFEVWNEPDSSGGLASLYGCFGTGYTGRLKYLLNYVNNRTVRPVGVSFAVGSQAGMDMLAAVAPAADWVGIHHYAVWGGGIVQETWPGSLDLVYQMAQAAAPGKPVWITEVNLRSPGDECGPEHQQAQADYILAALDVGAPMMSILVYGDYPNWQCTGIRGTIAAEKLMPGYPAPPP